MWLGAVKLPPLCVLCGLVLVAGMTDLSVEFRAPRFVGHHGNATLVCDHNVYKHDEVDKVVFYKDGQRIMKFVRERDPQFEFSNFTFAENNLLLVTPNSMTLERMEFSASGKYACEVAIETPIYSKLSKIHEMNVIVRQKNRPKIKIKHKKLLANDYLEATCQSPPAHPAPHLTWYINKNKVDERLTVPYGTENVHRHHHGKPLFSTTSSLHFPLSSLQLFPNQTVNVTCLSTIPSYVILGEGFADAVNNSLAVNVVLNEPPPTQLPVKIVSSELNSSIRYELDAVIVVLLLIVRHFFIF